MNLGQLEKLDEALDILVHVMEDVQEEREDKRCQRIAKKLDTICGKLDNLIWEAVNSMRGE